MLTIYLDHNIINHLKLNPKGDLANKLEELKPIAMFPYSRAILSDMCNGFDKMPEDKKHHVKDELDLISSLSDNYYIDEKQNVQFVRWYINDVKNMFKEELQLSRENLLDIMKLLEEPLGLDKELEEQNKSAINILKVTPCGFDFAQLNSIEGGQVLLEMFPNASKTGKMWDLMTDIIAWKDKLDDDPSSYLELRKFLTRETKLVGKTLPGNANIIDELDKAFLSTSVKKKFSQFSEDTLKNSKREGQEITLQDKFNNDFVMIDMAGYKADPMKKGYSNFFNDCRHSFLGAHCDFFITEDARTRDKANAVYKKHGINSISCSIKQFLDLMNSVKLQYDSVDIKNVIEEISKTEPVIVKEENGCKLCTYYLKPKFLNYFNQSDHLINADGTWSWSFSHNPENYMQFFAFKELEMFVNRMHFILGTDFRDRTIYSPTEENEKVKVRKWSGRKWILGEEKIEIYFSLLEGDTFPTMVIKNVA